MQRLIAIGDLHGCSTPFQKMLFDELKITIEDKIILMGDYIDRGTDSKGVIDIILHLLKEGYDIQTLRGNHEEMMMESMLSDDHFYFWVENGGNETLESFGVKSFLELLPCYLEFFHNTKYFIEIGDYIFVHAGLNFGKKDLFADKSAMLWIRDYHPQQPRLGNKILIHGHTPKPLNYILSQHGNCINTDAGCVYSGYPGMGNLVAVQLPESKFYVVSNK